MQAKIVENLAYKSSFISKCEMKACELTMTETQQQQHKKAKNDFILLFKLSWLEITQTTSVILLLFIVILMPKY